MRRFAFIGAAALGLALLACSRADEAAESTEPDSAMPVVVNSESPFQYPAGLFDQGIEGEVRLRLYVDQQGRVVPESTRVASSSGAPEFDSAAVRGSLGLRFAPGRRQGKPAGMAFYQPVIFRHLSAPAGDSTR